MDFCKEDHRGEVSSSYHVTVLLTSLVILTFIAWLRKWLPGFSTESVLIIYIFLEIFPFCLSFKFINIKVFSFFVLHLKVSFISLIFDYPCQFDSFLCHFKEPTFVVSCPFSHAFTSLIYVFIFSISFFLWVNSIIFF